MKCDLCKLDVEKGIMSGYAGFVCDGCADEARAIREAAIDDAREFDFDNIPDECGAKLLEEFVLSYAVMVLDDDESRAAITEVNMLLAVPEELALFWKEKLLIEMRNTLEACGEDPDDWLRMEPAKGRDVAMQAGFYSFVKPVHSAVLYKSATILGMIEEIEDE